MKQHNTNDEPTSVTGQLSAQPSSSSGSPRPLLTSRCIYRARNATPSFHRSVSLPPAPNELPAAPHGHRSFLRGLARRPAPPRLAAVPETVSSPIAEKKGEKVKKTKEIVSLLPSVDLLDRVPTELARAVVNMQEYYASGVDELMGKLGSVEDELRRARDENRQMGKRLDMHFVMLRQAAEFMQRVGEVRGVEMPGVDEVGGGNVLDDTSCTDNGNDGDVDSPTVDVNMEAPPTLVGDAMPTKSTGRKASNTRRPRRGCSARRRRGKENRRVAVREMPLRGRRRHARSGEGDGVGLEEGEPGLEILPEEESHSRSDGHRHEDSNDDDDDDGINILKGAPRLRALLRRSMWTAVNDTLSQPHTSPVDSDPDDYHPSSSSSSSSASSSSSSSSLHEENASPTITNIQPPSTPPKPQPPQTPSPQSRYSTPRHTTTPRYASGPRTRPFRFHRMGRTVLEVWAEYKLGTKGNPAIEALEREYGTGWRTGSLREVKYASNYVGVRQKVVNKVEEMCEREGIGAEEACRRLDERVDGRMQMLISAVRKGQDPFEVIPKRKWWN